MSKTEERIEELLEERRSLLEDEDILLGEIDDIDAEIDLNRNSGLADDSIEQLTLLDEINAKYPILNKCSDDIRDNGYELADLDHYV